MLKQSRVVSVSLAACFYNKPIVYMLVVNSMSFDTNV